MTEHIRSWRFSLPIGDRGATIQAVLSAESIVYAITNANFAADYTIERLDVVDDPVSIHHGDNPLFRLDDLVEVTCNRCGHTVLSNDVTIAALMKEQGTARVSSVMVKLLNQLCRAAN